MSLDKSNVKLRIIRPNGDIQEPPLEGDVTWETERKSSPGKLTCTIPKSSGLSFQEGDYIEFRQYNPKTYNYDCIFYGRVFTKQRNSDQLIKVTAYDNLRFLKNKYTAIYEDKKASEIGTNGLDTAKLPYKKEDISDTNYVISSLTEDEQTMFDIIQDAIDLTVYSTTTLYVLWCDGIGNIHLNDAAELKKDIIIDNETAGDFDYTSSIDENTYNKIYLYYDNDETNKREEYIAQDNNHINEWGTLKYSESINTNVNADDKVKKLLELYNIKTRKLKISKAFGDVNCRAGCSVIVKLNLGDIIVSHYMMIEKATHKFTNGLHTMDLTLSGLKEFVS